MDRVPVHAPARFTDDDLAPPRRTRWLPWVVLGLVSLATSILVVWIAFNPVSRNGSADVPNPEERRVVAVAYVDVEGGIRPLYPTMPGRVIEAPVPEGKEVEAGAVLLRIDDALAQARLKEAKYDAAAADEKLVQAKKLVAQHKTKMDIQKASLEGARKELEAAEAQARKAQRIAGDLAGKEDVESANRLVEKARANVRAEDGKLLLLDMLEPQSGIRLAQLDVDAKAEQVKKAELGVRECTLTAPTKGMVLRRLVNVGEVLGQTPNRPAIEFCPSGDRIVRAEVEQEFENKLYVGQKAVITDDITGSGEWHGEVERISDWFTQRRAVLLEPMQFNDSRTLEVILKLKAGGTKPLRINQRVRVRLDGEK